ncbi:hypothetical protein SS50377_24889 [Spironucleus salmonicida]|uniref:Transmembrane protein n=1 Tax=Spironucleus salmonicida TaxID=348837 RepID=V6LFS2_9EUKA|nr:hypothetical protein SS50377_24889 [Spironucleus salmonicida]|eukprot:EST43138.1 Hypothetical protein SS50377_17195 [Spironucleus salmonicida]
MLVLLLSASSPNCFSTNTYLEGDIQSRILTVYLIPQNPIDPLCIALNDSESKLDLIYRNAEDKGLPLLVSEPFIYRPGVINEAHVSISALSPDQIIILIEIIAADYIVKIAKAADYHGTFDIIKYLKQDVSSCWSNLIFSYSAVFGEEQLSFELVPNDCTIPPDAELFPSFTFNANESVIVLAEFQEGNGDEDYKHPYIHNQVKFCKLVCREIVDSEKMEECLRVIDFMTISLQYLFGLELVYFTGEIKTEVIQETMEYQGDGSIDCAEVIGLLCYINPDGYILYHEPLADYPQCIIDEKTVLVKLQTMIQSGSLTLIYNGVYTLEQYSTQQYLVNTYDMKPYLNSRVLLYPQFIQFNNEEQISGQFYTTVQTVKQCIYLIILDVKGQNNIELQFRCEYNEVCNQINEEIELELINGDQNILFQQFFKLKLDQKISIQKVHYQLKKDIRNIIKNNQGVVFTVRGSSFYIVSNEITFDNMIGFLAIQLSFVILYLTAGILIVFIIITKQNKAD